MVFTILAKILHGVHHGDAESVRLLEEVQLYLIPIVNPDGVAYIEANEKGDGQI